MLSAVPQIDDDIPLPASATQAMPDLSPAEELQMRARTISLLAEIQGKPLEADAENIRTAESLARQMMNDPHLRPDYAKYPNETMAYLAGLVARSNCMIVDELSELKLYVVNKLVQEVEEADNGKTRIAALKLLGEVDGVDAFKKRTEIEHKFKPIEEVEQELFSVLNAIEGVVVKDSGVLPAPEAYEDAEDAEIDEIIEETGENADEPGE